MHAAIGFVEKFLLKSNVTCRIMKLVKSSPFAHPISIHSLGYVFLCFLRMPVSYYVTFSRNYAQIFTGQAFWGANVLHFDQFEFMLLGVQGDLGIQCNSLRYRSSDFLE